MIEIAVPYQVVEHKNRPTKRNEENNWRKASDHIVVSNFPENTALNIKQNASFLYYKAIHYLEAAT